MFTRNSRQLRREGGLTFVELVIFIMIVSIAVAGVLLVMTRTTANSADPMRRKQALAIAEALLEEVQMMPFTQCDPEAFDAIAGTCARVEGIGPEPAYGPAQAVAETRGSLTAPFDNVNDYNGLILTGGSTDLGNSANVTVPAGYTARVAILEELGLGPAGAQVPPGSALRITVTVTYGANPVETIVVEGYRTRYAPTSMP